MERDELIKKIVKFVVLRYVITRIVSRTVLGKHKEAYVEPILVPLIEATIDVLRENRGKYVNMDIIKVEAAKLAGFDVEKKRGGYVIYYKPPNSKKRKKLDDGSDDNKSKVRRTIMYAIHACRDVFGLVEIVQRTGRQVPERYVEDDRGRAISRRLTSVVERLTGQIIPYLEANGAYVCPNLKCDVFELYTQDEAESKDYICKGKIIRVTEYEQEGIKSMGVLALHGCGSYLSEIEKEVLENTARVLNVLIDLISRQSRSPFSLCDSEMPSFS